MVIWTSSLIFKKFKRGCRHIVMPISAADVVEVERYWIVLLTLLASCTSSVPERSTFGKSRALAAHRHTSAQFAFHSMASSKCSTKRSSSNDKHTSE